MKIVIELEYWEAVRLQSLVIDGHNILNKDGRTQRGIDGYTKQDLKKLNCLFDLKDSPKFANKLKS